ESSDRTMLVEVDLANEANFSKQDLRGGTERLVGRPADLPTNQRLVPGMNGYMRLHLDRFGEALLLPSSAVFSRGGKQYIMTVREGGAKTVPVEVQINDGRLVKVAVLQEDPQTGHAHLQELTGSEEIVATRQAELENGQRVVSALQEW